MNSKDPIRAAVGVLFFLIWLGLQIAPRLLWQIPSPRTAMRQFETDHPVKVTILMDSNHKMRDFVRVKDGMSVAEVEDVFLINRMSERTEALLRGPETLALYRNPDGTSIEIIFRDGKMAAKEIYSEVETMTNAEKDRAER